MAFQKIFWFGMMGCWHPCMVTMVAEFSLLLQLSETEMEKMVDRLQMVGKIVIDVNDPNRPRFTLNELRDVLQEKNELKTKLIEVEEELAQYRPPP